jgi:D-alanyl-D-alanine carboxypeptidase
MATSQNGWPVVPRSAVDERPLIRNVRVPNGVLAGDVAVIFRWLAAEYDRRVEPLDAGECWGWFVKSIEGSSTISNHASGTAADFNAPQNPMGQGTTKRSMTAAQINTCHRIEDESDDVLRWGGDYVSRQDPMHWEIVGSRAAVRQFAAKIRKDAEPPRKVETVKIAVTVPILKQGDDDARLEGYNRITRMQRIIGADDDGVWGPATTKAIAAWCKLPVDKCRTANEEIVRKVFGLSE